MSDSMTEATETAAPPRTVLVSRTDVGPLSESLGKAHYSYGFAARAFTDMFEQNGVPISCVVNPEHFKTNTYAEVHELESGRHLHLMFRSTAEIRPIAGAYNIACFAWEFEVLKADGLPDEYVVEDQVRMLRACDEVWTPCRFTERVLRQYGVSRVRVIAAPIAPRPIVRPTRESAFRELALFESTPLVSSSAGDQAFFEALAEQYVAPLGAHQRVRRAMAEGGKIFLTVCNPYDKRKNVAAMIEGFTMATQGRDDVVLVAKLVTSGMFEPPSGYLFHQMRVIFGIPHCIKEEGVILMSSHLSDDQMDSLYGAADFYLCTSIGEGQNLPLMESMSAGCVPVSTANTAMADYLTPHNAIIVDEGRYSGLISGLAGDVAGKRLTTNYADRYQVAAAVQKALELDSEAYAQRSSAARASITQGYSPQVIYERITKALTSSRPDVAPPPWAVAQKAPVLGPEVIPNG